MTGHCHQVDASVAQVSIPSAGRGGCNLLAITMLLIMVVVECFNPLCGERRLQRYCKGRTIINSTRISSMFQSPLRGEAAATPMRISLR